MVTQADREGIVQGAPASDGDSTRRLARLRAYTRATLLPGPALATLVGGLLLANEPRRLALTGLLWAIVVAACALAMWWTILALHEEGGVEPEPAGRLEQVTFGVGILLVGSGIGLAAASGPVGFIWPLLAGLLGGLIVMRIPVDHQRTALLVTAVTIMVGHAVLVATGSIDAGPAVAGVAVAAAVILATWMQWWTYMVALRLVAARAVAAELAVAEERLRFAAELHDVQGHHLQVIMLKSELAARLADRDADAAAAEMREVNQLARQALSDTREVVGGYRRTPIGVEIANAVGVLRSAGIAVETDGDEESSTTTEEWIDEASGRLLGLVVREATTNLLRHANARHAGISLSSVAGRYRLRVHNDGVSSTRIQPGNGLGQLTDRLAAAGGELRWRAEEGEFDLTAELPDPRGATGPPETGR